MVDTWSCGLIVFDSNANDAHFLADFFFIVLHTHTAHTHEDIFRHTHTRVTQYIEKGGTRQELGELRVTDKSVVESRVSESHTPQSEGVKMFTKNLSGMPKILCYVLSMR